MIHKKLSTIALLTTCLYAVHGTQPNTAQATTEPAPSVPVAAAPAPTEPMPYASSTPQSTPTPYAPATPTSYAPAATEPIPYASSTPQSTPTPYAPATPTSYAPAAIQLASATNPATPTQAQPKAADQRNYLRMFAKFVVDALVVLIVSGILVVCGAEVKLFANVPQTLQWFGLIASIILIVSLIDGIIWYIFGFLHGLINKLFEPSQNATQAQTFTGNPAMEIPHQHQYPQWQQQMQDQHMAPTPTQPISQYDNGVPHALPSTPNTSYENHQVS